MPSSASIDIAAVTSIAVEHHVEVGQGEHEHAEHAVGAVDQRQPLLGPQRDRRDAVRLERAGGVALADQ